MSAVVDAAWALEAGKKQKKVSVINAVDIVFIITLSPDAIFLAAIYL